MALTQQEGARLTVLWRGLAQLSLSCVNSGPSPQSIEKLKTDGHTALNWASPLPGYHDAFVLFAFARFAAAFGKCGCEAAQKRAPVLRGLAQLVLDMLPSRTPPEPPPRLPFRADIDG